MRAIKYQPGEQEFEKFVKDCKKEDLFIFEL